MALDTGLSVHCLAHRLCDRYVVPIMRGNFRWYAARCGKGHLFDEANTQIDKRGYQRCRRCDREKHRKTLMIPKTKWRME